MRLSKKQLKLYLRGVIDGYHEEDTVGFFELGHQYDMGRSRGQLLKKGEIELEDVACE